MYSHKPIARDTTPIDWSMCVCVCVCVEGGGEEGGQVRGGKHIEWVYSTAIYHNPHKAPPTSTYPKRYIEDDETPFGDT